MAVMAVRRHIFPRTITDCCSMIFLLLIVPLLYWFELWVVLPALYGQEWIPYIFHFLLGNFIMLNIVGNYTYTVLCDTSIARLVIPVSTVAEDTEDWRVCTSCEAPTPPRSWHCSTCNVCILKRDHHCIFTGCCIGHLNHRYFIMFLFYLFMATVYSFYYNNIFIWNRVDFDFPMSLIKMIFPLAIFLFGFDGSLEQFYLLLYIVSTIGMLFTGLLCVYHLNLVFAGRVANESNKRIYKYNLGWKQNFKEVMGERWYLACMVPYVKSDLPHDGIMWDTRESSSSNSLKGR